MSAMTIPNCPDCGGEPGGVVQMVYGVALLMRNAYGYEYAGETKVNWDSQRTVCGRDGAIVVCSACGGEYQLTDRLDAGERSQDYITGHTHEVTP